MSKMAILAHKMRSMDKKRITAAFIYDFDGTLSPGNMQEYAFMHQLGIPPREFWAASTQRAIVQQGDQVLAYMYHMLHEANHKNMPISRASFREYAHDVELFPGVEGWFERINAYGASQNIEVQHFIISSGLREMLEGISIYPHFTKVYASGYMYDANGIAFWPALAVNYTTKTQFLFRINKGALDEWDSEQINAYQPKDKRPVPFSRMVYFGDGSTDIPCMKLVKEQGGFSIAIYRSDESATAERLLTENRVCFISPADYSQGSRNEMVAMDMLNKMAASAALERW